MLFRSLQSEQLTAAADGRVFIAHKAHGMGLIDGVKSFDAAFEDFAHSARTSLLRSQQVQRSEALMAKYSI